MVRKLVGFNCRTDFVGNKIIIVYDECENPLIKHLKKWQKKDNIKIEKYNKMCVITLERVICDKWYIVFSTKNVQFLTYITFLA